jgi:DNA-binding NarL/FixJ family response regulator
MSITIFLADDHAIVRDGLRLMLEDQPDMKVVGMASNGRDALNQVQKLSPNVAVLDVTMPELNGIEAANYISDTCPSTSVIMLSMHSGTEQVLWAFKAGAKGYVLKESTGEDIIEAVRTVSKGGFFLSEGVLEKIVDYNLEQQMDFEQSNLQSVLSHREQEILKLVVEGKTSKAIGDILSISPKTVNSYRYRMMEKLNVKDVAGLVKMALQNGLTELQ